MNTDDRLNLLKEILDKTASFSRYVYKAINAEIDSSTIYSMDEIGNVIGSFNSLNNYVNILHDEWKMIRNKDLDIDNREQLEFDEIRIRKQFDDMCEIIMDKNSTKTGINIFKILKGGPKK